MGALAVAISSLLGQLVGRLFAVISSHYLATKVILTVLFITVLPIILNNLIVDLTTEIFSVVSSNLDTNSVLSQTVFQFAGLAGWFIQVLKLDVAFSVVISAIALRFTLKLIPFVGV